MARDRRRASGAREEGIGGSRVDPLPLRKNRVARDRLLGESVAPDVAVARVRALLEELLRDGGLESYENDLLVGLGDVDEQSVLERPPEHRGRPQHVDLLRV